MFQTTMCSSLGRMYKQLTVFYHTEMVIKLYELSSYNVTESIKCYIIIIQSILILLVTYELNILYLDNSYNFITTSTL
jgi:hypothetical protein